MSGNRTFFYMSPEDYHGKIPVVLVDLINELKRRDVCQVQGIFRINGNDTDIKRLISELDQGPVKDWSKFEDIHVVSCALKRYFRSMADREPILSNEILDCLLGAVKIPDETRQRQLIRTTVRMLSRPRFLTLAYLMTFLAEIAANSAVNLMVPSNIAICFGPNLISSDSLTFDDALADQQAVNQACAIMIKAYPEIFDGAEFTPNVFCSEDDISELQQTPLNMMHVQNQILRCSFRKGKTIPFVPLSKILKTDARPTRAPPTVAVRSRGRLRSLFVTASLGPEAGAAFASAIGAEISGDLKPDDA
jgi:hypothetical protein